MSGYISTVRTRLENTRDYVKEHAPELITAAASVSILFLLRDEVKARVARENHENQVREGMRDAIDYGEATNTKYKYFPGIGVLTLHNQPLDPEK